MGLIPLSWHQGASEQLDLSDSGVPPPGTGTAVIRPAPFVASARQKGYKGSSASDKHALKVGNGMKDCKWRRVFAFTGIEIKEFKCTKFNLFSKTS